MLSPVLPFTGMSIGAFNSVLVLNTALIPAHGGSGDRVLCAGLQIPAALDVGRLRCNKVRA